MGLGAVLKLGYALVCVSVLLMVWASLARAETERYPPCVFNQLCRCSKAVPDLGLVYCQDVPLPRLPRALNSSKVFALHLEGNGLHSLEPGFLQASGLYRLKVTRNPLADVPSEAFVGLERSLWELSLANDQLVAVPSRALRHLQKLRKLDLTGNLISEVAPEHWRGLEESLQTLVLADNAISALPPDTFAALSVLEELNLSGNDLLGLDAVFRAGPPRITRLLLADNLLPTFPYQHVIPLRTLRTLDLSGNLIHEMHSPGSEPEAPGSKLSLDTLYLQHNLIERLQPGAFQHFGMVNRTVLDGNPLVTVQADAFQDARIRELSLRDCGLTNLAPSAFSGLELSLQFLDLSANNLTSVPKALLHEFDFLRTLLVRNNRVPGEQPNGMAGFQYSLQRVDMAGREMGPTSLQEMRRMRNLRSVTLGRLPRPSLGPDDFSEFGVDLEELNVAAGNLQSLQGHVFRHVRGLRRLDLSENSINTIDYEAFVEVGHSLEWLRIAHGLSSSINKLPSEALRPLTSLQELDLSNNRLRSMPETSFHFLRKLRTLRLQDNQIDAVHKGTFQGGLHSALEDVYLSYNNLPSVKTHTFVDLHSLRRLYLDDNKIERVERRSFMNMNRLRRLNLRGNKIREVSDEAFQNLPELEMLDMAYNKMRELDFAMMDQVGTLATLRLNASHNEIQRLEGHAGGAYHSNVKVLDVSHNNVTYISRGYLRPVEVSLTHLYLAHNVLHNATREVFGNMPHLQWLDLSHNQIYELDFDTFRNTRNLQVLDLDHNQLTDVPSELFRSLSAMRVVRLSNNRLRSVPDSLWVEGGLEYLDLSHNSLGRPPTASLGSAAAASLCHLDLSHNVITSLQGADTFDRLESLSWLDLSHNRLVRVEDATFSPLTRLSTLDLSHNTGLVFEARGRSFKGLEDSLLELRIANCSLSTVPELPLPSLRSLVLAHNELTEVPLDLAVNTTALRNLDLSYNYLAAVPLVSHSLPQLRELSLAGNPISVFSNTTMIGGAQRLRELDIRRLPLYSFENGALGKMTSLRSLQLSPYKDVRHFNIPHALQQATGLRRLHVEVHQDPGLQNEMSGVFPKKLRNLTMSGNALRSLPNDLLQGVRSPWFHLSVHNSSLETIPRTIFQRAYNVRNITVDVRDNQMRGLSNPSIADVPGTPRGPFLTGLWMDNNTWSCDCNLGWAEMWQRKKRQYLCHDNEEEDDDDDNQDYHYHYYNPGRHMNCREFDDDMRVARCSNKNNASMLEVFKADVECGWGSGAMGPAVVGPLLLLAASLALLA